MSLAGKRPAGQDDALADPLNFVPVTEPGRWRCLIAGHC
jgi:hypothetical protein